MLPIADLPIPPALTLLRNASMNTYYVYAYLRQDGTPYYIGKGKGARAWTKSNTEINKPPENWRIIIVEQNLSEIGALAIERRLIRWYGRKDLQTGILRNQTDGGDGSTNIIPWNKGNAGPPAAMSTRLKMSRTRKGVKKTDVTRQRMSAARKGEVKSPEQKEKLRQAQLAIPKTVCEHCKTLCNPGNYTRWHGERCRMGHG